MGSTRAVLFVDHASALGGAERSLLMLMERLSKHAWQPHLACTSQALAVEARERGLAVHSLDLPRLRRSGRFLFDWVRGARGLAALSGDIGALALYSNTVRATFYSTLAARIARRPLIWHMRDFWLSESRPRHLFADHLGKGLMLAASSAVITNSGAVAGNLPRSPKKRVVHNGIDVKQFVNYDDGQSFRKRYNLSMEAPLVGTVGRLRPWKGQDRFLRVAAKVVAERADVHFAIVGGSPMTENAAYPEVLRHMARKMGLQDNVHFTGQLDDVRPVLAAMDLFVHAGDPEPFGLVNVEAMAMGLPVIAFGHGALPEIVEEGSTGRLVAAGDESGMAQAILTLLADSGLRAEMGNNGRRRAVIHFDVERTVSDISAILHEVTRVP